MLLAILKTLIALQSGLQPDGRYPEDYGLNLKNGDAYDFIVVGAGSAGSVVARRLSDIAQWKILLLEAGGYPSGMSEIPALAFSLQDSEEDWQYKMKNSTTSCLGLKNHRCTCARGKGLGGSSTINIMMYTRSTRHDHERWTKQGNVGWDYDSIVKYYKKFENVHIDDNRYYGMDGELHITRHRSIQPIRESLAGAYKELGYNEYTEDKPLGYRDLLMSIYEGTRQNTAKAFLSPIKDRKNLHVATNAKVTKILVDSTSLTATGIEVQIQNRIVKLKATKEVILSAGAVDSPRILMHSGIGPEEHLTEMGIRVVKDLRVGENYQDHISYPLLAIGVDNSAVATLTSFEIVNELYQYFINRKGLLSNMDLAGFTSYANTKNETKFSNVQYVHAIVPPKDSYLGQELLRAFRAPEDVVKTLIDFNQQSAFLILAPIVLNPKSLGHIRIQSNDPFSDPLITPNFLNDPNNEDIEVLVDAINIIEKLLTTKALKSLNPKLLDLNIKNCADFVFQSRDYWKCAVRNLAFAIFHPVGTCKMGPVSDKSTVVDPQLRVHGVNSLRVIDASIMPVIPSCNTNAPTIMIGEKGAELIKQKWLRKHDEL